MRFIGDIALDAEVRAIASGAITDGEPVIVNSAGTVSACADAITGAFGTAVEFESGDTRAPDGTIQGTFDSNSNKVVIGYKDADNSDYGTAVVATIDPSDNSVSFGTPVVFESAEVQYVDLSFDSSVNKVAIAFVDRGDSNACKAIIGTVSGTGISFGSAVTFKARTGDNQALNNVLVFDSNANKTAVFYVDFDDSQKLFCRVMSISGTTPSFGTEVEVVGQSQYSAGAVAATFDSNSNKVVIFYIDAADSNKGKARVGTISGTDISFGTAAVFRSGAYSFSMACAFDSTNNKTVNIYRDNDNSNYGAATVGTVSGTDITFGTPVVYTSHAVNLQGCVYDSSVNRIIVLYRNSAVGDTGNYNVAQVSGTTLTFGTAAIYLNFSTGGDVPDGTYDSNAERILLPYRDTQDSDKGKAVVMKTPVAGNLTSENFIGFANAAYADGQKATVKTTGSIARNVPAQLAAGSAGTPVVPDEEGAFISATFDSNSNRVVVAYQDGDNSNYGTAVVGTVTASDNSISHGTPVVFNSANTYYTESTFDSNSNRVVITYRNIGDSNRGTAIVGTVDPSDNSISFGTAVVYEAGETSNSSATFDSSNNKVVIAYEDEDDSGKGKAIVGTVSGTSISFGTAAVFNNADTGFTSTAFDTTNNKVVIAFADKGNSNRGTAIVGTVSGTDISFGSEAIFNSGTTAEIHHSISFNPVAGKMLIAYVDTDDGEKGKAIVGTVSGTSISFGTASVYNTRPEQSETVYDSQKDLIVIVYGDNNNSRRGTAIGATISGTSVSFSAELAFHSSSGNKNGVRVTYDSNASKAVAAYTDAGNSNVLTTTVFATAGNGPLVIGQQYFVQTDGTLGTSADDPSVIAGTAIGASDIIVKG